MNRKPFRLLPVLLLGSLVLLPLAVPGQAPDTAPTPAAASPSLDPQGADSLGKTTAVRDTSGPKSRADTVLVVKHHFDHREQIITGSVVMTCLALMMVVMNNYNPR